MRDPSTAVAMRDALEHSRLELQALEPLANARGADAEWQELSRRLRQLRGRSRQGERDDELEAALHAFVLDAEHLVDRVIGGSDRSTVR